jgi:hypothetical protein
MKITNLRLKQIIAEEIRKLDETEKWQLGTVGTIDQHDTGIPTPELEKEEEMGSKGEMLRWLRSNEFRERLWDPKIQNIEIGFLHKSMSMMMDAASETTANTDARLRRLLGYIEDYLMQKKKGHQPPPEQEPTQKDPEELAEYIEIY